MIFVLFTFSQLATTAYHFKVVIKDLEKKEKEDSKDKKSHTRLGSSGETADCNEFYEEEKEQVKKETRTNTNFSKKGKQNRKQLIKEQKFHSKIKGGHNTKAGGVQS